MTLWELNLVEGESISAVPFALYFRILVV